MRLIDADALKAWFLRPYSNEETYSNIDICSRKNSSPTVDAEPVKHGHWVEQEHEDWKWSKEYRCSECGQYRLVTTPVGREWKYCPNCGAYMEAEDGN